MPTHEDNGFVALPTVISNFIGINTMTKYNLSGVANGTGMTIKNGLVVSDVISLEKSTKVRPQLATINDARIHDGLGVLVGMRLFLFMTQEDGTFYINATVTDTSSMESGHGRIYADTTQGIPVTIPFSLSVFNPNYDKIIPLGRVETVISIDKIQDGKTWKDIVLSGRALEVTFSSTLNAIVYNDELYEVNYFDSIPETLASPPQEGFSDYTVSILTNQGTGIIFYRVPSFKNTGRNHVIPSLGN